MNYEYALLALAGLLSVPALVCCGQVLLALPARRQRQPDAAPRPRIAVLMPAHDEALVIAGSLRTILPQLGEGDRLLVVADNCTDDTAGIAAGLGAEVVERCDPGRRGKGYALDFGLHRLKQDAPEIVIIVDADCAVHEGCIDRLAHLCMKTSRPVQALYLMRSHARAKNLARLAEFAWVVKNWVRPSGFARLGLPCQLMGTGMAFPWRLVQRMQLANASIVEDMQLGIDLAVAGHPAIFCPEAKVSSDFPLARAAVGVQRARWEHGHLSMIASGVPKLLGAAIARRDVRLLGLALDLAVPPLALLTLLAFSLFASALIVGVPGGSLFFFCLASLPLCLMTIAILCAWAGWGRRLLSFAVLFSIPLYVASKMPLYLQFLIKRQRSWVKTRRD